MHLSTSNPVDPEQLETLRRVVGAGPVLILTHDNPDPDALASGKAFATLLASAWHVRAHMVFSGHVLRAENQAMLTLLTPEWEHHDTLPRLSDYSAVVLVDTQPGAGNNRLPASSIPVIVLDHHHPLREALQATAFVDVRPDIGATVTLIDAYLTAAGVTPDPDLATAMFYGLKTDTRGLSRGTSPADIAVYLKLLSQIDRSKLIKIEQAGLSQAYFKAFSQGLLAARVYERSVVADLGQMHRPDLAAEMADILIRLDHAIAVMCLGVYEQTLHLSIRTRPMGQDAGLLVQQVIVAPGKAGGHGTMAGGQLPLADSDSQPVVDAIIRRFLTIMGETGTGQSLC